MIEENLLIESVFYVFVIELLFGEIKFNKFSFYL